VGSRSASSRSSALTTSRARITTQTGPANQITVDVEGSQRYIDSLTIEQDGDVVSDP
jgi:hypothetical protein